MVTFFQSFRFVLTAISVKINLTKITYAREAQMVNSRFLDIEQLRVNRKLFILNSRFIQVTDGFRKKEA